MTEALRKISQPDGGRVECGVIQFGDDWPGIFIRGDNALALSMAIKGLAINPYDMVFSGQVQELGRLLASCDVDKCGPVAKWQHAADLKSADESREGSSPSRPTRYKCDSCYDTGVVFEDPGNPKPPCPNCNRTEEDLTPLQRWKGIMPSSECDIQVGQKRMFFIDGVGDMEGTIQSFDENFCYMLETGETDPERAWGIGWDMPGMSHVGILIDGEEYKAYMRDVEREALNAGSVQS